MKEKLELFIKEYQDLKWITVISILGFICTGVLMYPYGSWPDDMAVYAMAIGTQPFTNHIGWAYPSLWKLTNKIFFLDQGFGIGIFINLSYWICMPYIYHQLFNFMREKKWYTLYYLLFIGNPLVLLAITNISGPMVVMAFMLIITSLFLAYRKNPTTIKLVLIYILLICSAWIRRDSLLLSIPFLIMMFVMNKYKLYKIILGTILFIGISTGSNSLMLKLTKADMWLDTTRLIMKYDMIGMSYQKRQVLMPRVMISPSLSNLTDEEIIHIIGREWNFWNVGRTLTPHYPTEKDFKKEDIIPVYFKNIHWYIGHRLAVLYRYLMAGFDVHFPIFSIGPPSIPVVKEFFEKQSTLSKISFKIRRFFFKSTKVLLFQSGFYYFLMAIFLFFTVFFTKIYQTNKAFVIAMYLSGVFNFVITILGSVNIELRYIVWFSLSMWILVAYTVAIYHHHYKIVKR